MNEVARESIRKDENFHNGNYYEHDVIPKNGLKTARMLGHITYLSEEHMDSRFGRKFQDEGSKVEESVSFEVENYLQYKGEQFSELFDANSYILMTKVMDSYDAGKSKTLDEALKDVKAEFLIVGFTQIGYIHQKEERKYNSAMNNNIKSSFVVLQGDHGHDSFLFNSETYSNLITNFINHNSYKTFKNYKRWVPENKSD